jgi:hypothetical protein
MPNREKYTTTTPVVMAVTLHTDPLDHKWWLTRQPGIPAHVNVTIHLLRAVSSVIQF